MRETSREGASVVVLAKDARASKRRLKLQRDEARQVALLLAGSTVRTALEAATVGAVLVVSGDAEIMLDAIDAGADVVVEPGMLGMNRAAEVGRRCALAARPDAPVAVMVADLPHLLDSHINAVVQEYRATEVPLYVPDHLGAGTTFLIHGPEWSPGYGFGRGSASMHRRLGYKETVTAVSGLRADLDTRDDLDSLAEWIPRASALA